MSLRRSSVRAISRFQQAPQDNARIVAAPAGRQGVAKPSRYKQQDINRYVESGERELMTLSHIWDRNAELYPGRETIEDTRATLTWAEAKR